MKKAKFIVLSLSLMSLISEEVLAREKETLPEVVVTATRTEKEVELAPASLSVVKKERLEIKNVKTIDEALNDIPGVHIQRVRAVLDTPPDTISVRGVPSYNRNLIMIDGIQLNDPQGGLIRLGGLRLEDFDRIEVVKGPFSALYGGQAIGGVINIISTLPTKREFTIKAGYGSSFDRGKSLDDLRKIYVSYGDRLGNFNFFASFGHQALNGFPNYPAFTVLGRPPAHITGWKESSFPEGKTIWIVGDTGDHKGWINNFVVRFGYDLTKNTKISFSILKVWDSSSYDKPHTYLRDPRGNPVWSYFIPQPPLPPNVLTESMFLSGKITKDYTLYNLNFETRIKGLKTKLTFGLYDQDKHLFTTPCAGNLTFCLPHEHAVKGGGPGKVHDTPAKNYIADLQFNLPVTLGAAYLNNHLLTFGLSYRKGEAKTEEHKLTNWKDTDSKTNLTYKTRGEDETIGIYIQDEIPVSEKLTFYLGARYDWWKTSDGFENMVSTPGYPKKYKSRDDSFFSPKFSFVYKISEKTTVRGSIGKAFRFPTLMEQYRSFMTPAHFKYGNPKLKPEESSAWDLGIRHSLWTGNKIELFYFENYLEDYIYYRKTGRIIGPREVHEASNLERAKIRGVEFSFEQKLGEALKLFTNLTWNDAKIKKNSLYPKSKGKRLPYVPETMFNVGLEYNKGPILGSIISRYRSKVFGTEDNSDKKEGVFSSYDSYFVTDAKISLKLLKNSTLSLSVNNLFDRKYYFFYLQPRRSYFLDFSYKF